MAGRAGGPFKAAQEAYERGEYAAVVELIKEDGSRAVPYPMLVCKGLAAQQIGQYEVAEDVLKRAAELQPDLPKAWRGLADVYQARGAWLKAIEPLQAMQRIAQSKSNEGRAVAIALEVAECLEKGGKSAEAREALRAIITTTGSAPLPVGVRGRALSRMLPLEEKRLVLFPRDRPKELTALYGALLDGVEAAMARGDDDGGGGGGGAEEGSSGSEDEWVSSALALLPALPELIMATTDKPMDWPHAVGVAKRVTAACTDMSIAEYPSASELRVLGWWYQEHPQDDEVELLRLSKSLVQAHPHRAIGMTMVAARLLKNGHLPQALDFLSKATSKQATPQWSLSWSLLCEVHALHTDFAHTDQATMAAALDKVDAMARAEASVWGKLERRDLALVNARCKGRYLEWTGDVDGARGVWQGLGPSDPEACLGLARIALSSANNDDDDDDDDNVVDGKSGAAEAAVEMLEGKGGLDMGAEAQALLGWALHVRGRAEDGARSRELLEKATEANPRHGYYLGRLYWDTGMREESLAALLKSAQAAPTHGSTFTALGDYYRLHAGDRVRALRCYTRAVTLSPLDQHAGNALSLTALQPRDDGGSSNEEAVAVAAWEAATRAHAGAGWAWRWLGVYHLRRGDLEQALMCAQYAIRAAPKDMQAWAVLGRAYRRSGKHAAALKALNRALELGADVLGEMGAAQAQAGLVDEAVASLAEAGRADGADVLTLKALAEALMAQGYARLAEGFRGCAMESVTRGIDTANRVVACSSVQRGSFCTPHKLKGDLSCMLMMIPGAEHTDVWEEAPEAYGHVTKASEHTAQALVDEAMCWYVLGRAKALAAGLGGGVAGGLTTTTTTTTTNSNILHTDNNTVINVSAGGENSSGGPSTSSTIDVHGSSHCDPACLEKAKQLVESAIRKDPTCASAWTGRALVEPWCTTQAGGGVVRGALIRQHCLIRSLQLQGNPEAWANLGVLYASMGREDLAREAFRGLQLVQDHPMMWLGLALLSEENGDLKSAREAYKAALEVGAHPEAQVGLAMVTHDKGEALAHALMFLDQRPTHAAGLNLAAMLLMDHAKKPHAAMELLQRCKALLEAGQARGPKGDAARRVVEWNLARANAASGADEQGQDPLLEARRLAARGEWGPLCALTSSPVPPGTDASLAVVWGIGASLAAYKAGQVEEAQSRLAALAASRPALTPQSLTQVVAASALCGFANTPPWPTLAPPARHAVLVGLQQCITQSGEESARHLRGLCKAVRLHPHDPQCWAALASRLVGDATAPSGSSSMHSSHAECARVAWGAVEHWRHGAAIDTVRPGQHAPDAEVRDDGALGQDHAGAAAVQWAAEATGQAPTPKLTTASRGDRNTADTHADTTPPPHRAASGLVSLLKSVHRHPHLPHLWLTLAHGVIGWGAVGDPASSAASPEVSALAVDLLRVMDSHSKHRDAVAVLDWVSSSDELDSRVRARKEAALGKLDEASNAYKGALKADPRWVEGWRELAEIYFAKRRSAAGRKCLETAISVLPPLSTQDSSDALRAAICGRLAQAHYVTGRGKEGMDAVGEACRAVKRPGAVPLLLRGLCWRLEGPTREKNAQDNFKKAVEASPCCSKIRELAQ